MKWLIGLVLLVLSATPALAQTEIFKSYTLQNAAVATGNGIPAITDKFTSLALQVTIQTTATVTFEATQNGTAWAELGCIASNSTTGIPVTTASSTGTYQCNVAGLSQFRARISSWTAGTVTVTGNVSTTIFAKRSNGLPAVGAEGECLKVVSGVWESDACGASEADTLDTVFDRGKVIDGANSLANAVRIGDGPTPNCFYTDATLGPQVRPCTDTNVNTIIPANFTWSLFDIEAALAMETVDPDAASTLLIWQYPNAAYRPKKSIWFGAGSLSTDGTQCTDPAERTPVASGPKLWTIICTDNDGSTIHGNFKTPLNWDASTVTFTHVYQQTAADTGVLNGDIACQARSNGEAPSSTYGTEIAIDDAAVVGGGSNDMTTSAAVTCAGTTVAAGDMLYWRYQLDATGTTTAVATLHHLGFLVTYSEVSRSQ